MTGKTKKLIIVGAGEFAEIAYEYFSCDSEYEVIAFAVESKYLIQNTLFNLPIIDVEKMSTIYPPSEAEVFVAMYYGKLNRNRRRLYTFCKENGYKCASYISSRAFVWHNVKIGENVFIFEDNTIQYHVVIGNNVVLWSGNHIGHRTIVEDDCWITSHDVISGFCKIGRASFIGVNATIGDQITIGEDSVIGAGCVIIKSLPERAGVYVGNPAKKLDRTSYSQFNVEENEI